MRRSASYEPTAWPRFLVGFLVLWGLLSVASAADSTGRWRLAILGLVILGAAVVEKVLYGTSPRRSLRALGLGRPGAWSLAIGSATAMLLLLVFPLASAVTGLPIRLRSDWLWVLIATSSDRHRSDACRGGDVYAHELSVETGRSTIWAPAVVHTAIDSFKLFVIPPTATTTFSLLLIVVSLFVPLLSLAVPRRLLTADQSGGSGGT
jgi:hypothetical protein